MKHQHSRRVSSVLAVAWSRAPPRPTAATTRPTPHDQVAALGQQRRDGRKQNGLLHRFSPAAVATQLAKAKAALDKYQSVDAAKADGYVAGVAVRGDADRSATQSSYGGGMGIHFVNHGADGAGRRSTPDEAAGPRLRADRRRRSRARGRGVLQAGRRPEREDRRRPPERSSAARSTARCSATRPACRSTTTCTSGSGSTTRAGSSRPGTPPPSATDGDGGRGRAARSTAFEWPAFHPQVAARRRSARRRRRAIPAR